MSGNNNTVFVGSGTNTVGGGSGGDSVTVNGGVATLSFSGWNDLAIVLGGATATINDNGGGLGVKVGSGADHLTINGMGADQNAWIELLSSSTGYSSVASIMSALHSDGHGGSLLNMAGSGSIDIAGVQPNHLSSSNFRVR